MNNTQKGDRLKIVPQGEQEEPEVYGITKGKQGVKLGRRAFLGTLGAGVLASTGGCSPGVKNCNAPLIDAGETEHTEQQRCDTLKAHSGRLAGVFISPDNTLMISASWDKTIKLWSLPEGKLLKTFEGHSDCVDCLALSSDGTLLVSGSRDKTLKLWSLPEGTLLHTFEHSDWVIAVAISPDNTILASSSSDSTVNLWKLPEGTLLHTLSVYPRVDSLAISPDGKLLALAKKGSINLLSLPNAKQGLSLYSHTDNVITSVAISPDGALLAATVGNTVELWTLPQGNCLKILASHEQYFNTAAFSADGKLLAVGGCSNPILYVWRVPEGELVKTFGRQSDYGFSGHIEGISFSPDGTLIAVGASELGAGEISLWTLPEGEPNWCVFDPAITKAGTTVREYRQMSSETVCVCDTIQVQAWSSLPGSTCVCDTVQVGSYTPPPPGSSGGGGHYWHPN